MDRLYHFADLSRGRVTLRWEGPRWKLRAMRLVDEETGRTLGMRPGGRYTFEMTGSERAFTVSAASREAGR